MYASTWICTKERNIEVEEGRRRLVRTDSVMAE
jgi:hypothetical protein